LSTTIHAHKASKPPSENNFDSQYKEICVTFDVKD
jgi:hypothetical protein